MDPIALDEFRLEMGSGSEIGLMVTIALIVFAVALGLQTYHFRFFKEQPKLYFTGVAAQLIGLPLLTLIMCFLFTPLPSVALGMLLVACCPGGNVSNLLALYSRANTALSISLTATSSMAAAFYTPAAILFWTSLYPPTRALLTEINLDAVSFLIQTFIILGLPLILGMLIARRFPETALKFQRPLALIGGIGLAAIIITGFLRYFDMFLLMGIGILGLVIVHNLLAFLLGYMSGVLIKTDTPSKRTLTLEVGIQNSGLGIVILLTQLGGLGGTAAVAGLWGTWHIVAGLILVGWFRINDRRSQHV